jgi:Holliday junction resolvase RusA-like endonuclease
VTITIVGADLNVRVYGRPAPKGSRNYGVTRQGKLRTWPASKFEEPWTRAVADATREALRHASQLEAPYEVTLEFYVAPPIHKRKGHDWPSQHDLDKLARTVIDGLVRGGAMSDDRHVTRLVAEKRWASCSEDAGVAIALLSQRAG